MVRTGKTARALERHGAPRQALVQGVVTGLWFNVTVFQVQASQMEVPVADTNPPE
jgi:hypothetical protein